MVRAVTTERIPVPTIESITTAVRSAAGELRNGRQWQLHWLSLAPKRRRS